MLVWKPILKAAIAGGLVGTLAQAVAQAVNLSVVNGAISVLAGVIVFLFTMFIKQGNKLAALQAYAERNKGDLEKLDAESRTVDKRISDSKHSARNEVTPLLVSVEERAQERLDELRERVARLEVKLEQFMERKRGKES